MCSVENGQGKGDRWRAQIELVKRISSIASRIDPLNRVCHPRFINKQTPDANGLTKYQVEQRIQSFYPEDWTPIGTKLRENVLDPFIYKDVGAGTPLKRSFLVLVTTDGYPTRESRQRWFHRQARRERERRHGSIPQGDPRMRHEI